MNKVSIRFFDNKEVRAVWDEERSKWWFSVVDIVAVLNEQDDGKARNYWKYLKNKFKKENNELVSATNQLNAMKESVVDGTKIKDLLKSALTNKINDREIFMKGIDYSYYYEEEE